MMLDKILRSIATFKKFIELIHSYEYTCNIIKCLHYVLNKGYPRSYIYITITYLNKNKIKYITMQYNEIQSNKIKEMIMSKINGVLKVIQ